MPPSFEQIRSIALRARVLSGVARDEYLDEACDGDDELRREVQSLLVHAATDDVRLRTGGASLTAMESEPAPREIGPYRILEPIGEGGFGDVYAAEQEAPIRRRVAVKILKRGMDTRALVARFRAEIQALALMDHPHIARILDAGETDSGRPYYVMDWIRGEPINRYCSERTLRVRERVELVAAVADAVAHAHRQGIVHRDLKPSNILVTNRDGNASPSVIDFGIAKALGTVLGDETMHTTQGQLLGTPSYMSPEQAGGGEVGPPSDVFSLGAVLYELLTGDTPISAQTLRGATAERIARVIRESEPRPPSARTEGEARRTCQGELDWIVLAALERDAGRRYPDAAAFAADLRRFLRGEPVEAASPSVAYRSARVLRRGWYRVREELGTGAARTGASVKLALQARRIAEERDRANRERETAERVATFLSQMLSALEPAAVGASLWNDLRDRIDAVEAAAGVAESERSELLRRLDEAVREANPTNVARRLLDEEILARAGRALEEIGDPEIAARLSDSLGTTYVALGMLEPAEPYLRRALGERRRLLGEEHEDTVHSLSRLVVLLQKQGRLEEAETFAREALARARSGLGDDHREALDALTNLGVVLAHRGKLEEAEAVRRKAVEVHRELLGSRDPLTITAIGNLGQLLTMIGRHGEAEGAMRECFELSHAVLGADHNTTISAGANLAMLLEQTGRSGEAETLMREALAASRRVRGDDHLETLMARSNLSTILGNQKKYAECEEQLREAYEGLCRSVGESHLYSLVVRANLGVTLRKLDRLDSAEAELRPALEAYRRAVGPDHPHTLNAATQLGDVLTARGALDEAEQLLDDSIERALRALPPSDWSLAVLRMKRARVHELRGRPDSAMRELELARAQFADSLGEEHARTVEAAEQIAALRRRNESPRRDPAGGTRKPVPPSRGPRT